MTILRPSGESSTDRSYAYVLLKTRQIRSLKVGKLARIPLDAVSEFVDRKLEERWTSPEGRSDGI